MARSWPSAIIAILLISSVFKTKAQISTPCTSSAISTFTPCLNFVTGSSGSGSSPTQDCCDSLKSLMTNNMDCACLIVTGNVPVSIPFINANLAISLPQACKSTVPLQCTASGVPLPAPGPVLFAPPPPPAPVSANGHALAPAPAPGPAHAHGHGHGHAPPPAPHSGHAHPPAPHSHSPKGSKAVGVAAPPPAESLDIAPAPSPSKFPLGPSANPGIRPVVNHPNSASTLFAVSLFPYFVLMFVGIVASNFF